MLTWPNKNGDLVGFHGTNHGITNDFMGENDGGSTIFLASPRNPREFHTQFFICAWTVQIGWQQLWESQQYDVVYCTNNDPENVVY